jgi:lichenan operon transcriptional antiterminator
MIRTASILTLLETKLSASSSWLAKRYGVGVKTILTDIEQLNDQLSPAAMIRTHDGTHRLLVIDPPEFARIKARLTLDVASFNDPNYRLSSIVSRLARDDTPARTAELAEAMNVSRNTVVTDVARLRRVLAPFEVTVDGRTNVGLSLVGPELGIRLAVLEYGLPGEWAEADHTAAVRQAVADAVAESHLPRDLIESLQRWAILAVDRMKLGHALQGLPTRYDTLRQTPAMALASRVVTALTKAVAIDFTEPETRFLAIPLAGRRTPLSLDHLGGLTSSTTTNELVTRIFARISANMDIHLNPVTLREQFAIHLVFMLNRLRYDVPISEDAVSSEVRFQYPVAYRMATIARDLTLDETGLRMDASELSLVTTYFQVFLDEHLATESRDFHAIVVTSRGPATAQLIASQLSHVLPPSTRFTTWSSLAPEIDWATADLVVATPGDAPDAGVPVIELAEVFDSTELLHKLDRLHLSRPGIRASPPGSFLASLLDEHRIIRFSPRTTGTEAVTSLVNHLGRMWLVDELYAANLARREKESSARINELVAFTHAVAPNGHTLICAMGLLPDSEVEPSLKVIWVMARPKNLDDSVLIRTYDDIIRLASDSDLVRRMSYLTSYEDFIDILENWHGHSKT